MMTLPAIDDLSSKHAVVLDYDLGDEERVEVIVDIHGIVVVGRFVGDTSDETFMLLFAVPEA